jgi:uncharacterized protein YifN (PemK superfamily)
MAEHDDDEEAGPATTHYPKKREVLGCDFSGMWAPPEMGKRRPIVILSASPARPKLALVIPLSTTPPNPVQPWHHKMSRGWDKADRWAKCDMIYAVSLDRLFLLRHGWKPDGKRRYLTNYRVTDEDFAAIQAGVLKALNIEPPKDKGPAGEAGP